MINRSTNNISDPPSLGRSKSPITLTVYSNPEVETFESFIEDVLPDLRKHLLVDDFKLVIFPIAPAYQHPLAEVSSLTKRWFNTATSDESRLTPAAAGHAAWQVYQESDVDTLIRYLRRLSTSELEGLPKNRLWKYARDFDEVEAASVEAAVQDRQYAPELREATRRWKGQLPRATYHMPPTEACVFVNGEAVPRVDRETILGHLHDARTVSKMTHNPENSEEQQGTNSDDASY